MSAFFRSKVKVLGVAWVCSVLAVAACSGSRSLSTAPTPQSRGSGSATITIAIPRRPASGATRQHSYYVSYNTVAATVEITPATGTPQPTTSLTCTPAGAPTQCSGTAPAPIGTDQFFVQCLSSTNAVLSSNTVMATIDAGVNPTIKLTLNPIVASVAVTKSSPSPAPSATPAPWLNATAGITSQVASLTVLDPSGAQIIGTGSFLNEAGNPISISFANSDASGATCLSYSALSPATTSCPTLASLASPGPNQIYVTLLTASGAPTTPPFDDPNIMITASGVSTLIGTDIPVSPTVNYSSNYSGEPGNMESVFGSDVAFDTPNASPTPNEDGIQSLASKGRFPPPRPRPTAIR